MPASPKRRALFGEREQLEKEIKSAQARFDEAGYKLQRAKTALEDFRDHHFDSDTNPDEWDLITKWFKSMEKARAHPTAEDDAMELKEQVEEARAKYDECRRDLKELQFKLTDIIVRIARLAEEENPKPAGEENQETDQKKKEKEKRMKDKKREEWNRGTGTKAIEEWRVFTEKCFANYSAMTEFPKPPAKTCHDTKCTARGKDRILKACDCNIEAAFKLLDDFDTKKERLRWHPDRFSACKEKKKFQMMAQEVFVVLDRMYQSKSKA